MNIREAKEEIIRTIKAYTAVDEDDQPVIPISAQRPLLLMGPPGIGKTAVMEQASKACGVGLLSYTITHHTRQSAVGLPELVHRTYGEKEYTVTQYTMSEIIGSVYEYMERTGHKKGILFIDEINCVSETLAPTILQFLQFKTFGTHKVPDGWIIAAAGNPSEYNASVRELDMAALDRVRLIHVEADFGVWETYAQKRQVHPAILSYLAMHPESFYRVELTREKRQFVTARGWEDLSELLKSYEELQVEVSEEIVGEFLQKEEITRDFAAYYRLYERYKTDYRVGEILEGTVPQKEYRLICEMAARAQFEERFTLTQLVMEALDQQAAAFEKVDVRTVMLHQNLIQLKRFFQEQTCVDSMKEFLAERRKALDAKWKAELLSERERCQEEEQIGILEEYFLQICEAHVTDCQEGFQLIRQLFEKECELRGRELERTKTMLERGFAFLEDCFGEGQELLLLETGLTGNPCTSTFISEHGCDAYFRHCGLLLYQKQENAMREECRAILDSLQE